MQYTQHGEGKNSHKVDIDWLCLDSQEADVVMPKNHNLTKLSEYLKYFSGLHALRWYVLPGEEGP
jgi:hypothetical protein